MAIGVNFILNIIKCNIHRTSMKTSAFNVGYTVHSTIDTILNKGAQELYSKYIMSKIPNHIHKDIQDTTQSMFNPVSMIGQNQKSSIMHVHEPMIENICVAERKKNNKSCIQRSEYPKTVKKSDMGQSLLLNSRKGSNSRDSKLSSMKQQLRASAACSRSSKSQTIDQRFVAVPNQPRSFFQEANAEEAQIFLDKMIRYDEQRTKEDEQNRIQAKTIRMRKRLQQQFRTLEENSRIIAFDHETGRILDLQDNSKKTTQNDCYPSKPLSMRYGSSEGDNKIAKQYPIEKTVTSKRKITTFVRSKRKRISLDGDGFDNADYNNNGNRQSSIIGFLCPEQGVSLVQGSKTVEQRRPASAVGRPSSASSNHRTFKSFTRQKMESSRYSRSINIAPSGLKTHMAFAQSKMTQRTSSEYRQSSILWSGKSCKNHHVNKNPSLVDNYFNFSQEALQ